MRALPLIFRHRLLETREVGFSAVVADRDVFVSDSWFFSAEALPVVRVHRDAGDAVAVYGDDDEWTHLVADFFVLVGAVAGADGVDGLGRHHEGTSPCRGI